MTTLEMIPDTWDADRDEVFFRITARLLPSAVVAGASSLLASYDDDVVAPHDAPASATDPQQPLPAAGRAAAVERRVP